MRRKGRHGSRKRRHRRRKGRHRPGRRLTFFYSGASSIFSPWAWTKSRQGWNSKAFERAYPTIFSGHRSQTKRGIQEWADTNNHFGRAFGATILPDMVERLDKLGAPVKLAIGLDLVFQTVSSGVLAAISISSPTSLVPLSSGPSNSRGSWRMSTWRGYLGVGHITIDKNEIMQQKVISAINSAL